MPKNSVYTNKTNDFRVTFVAFVDLGAANLKNDIGGVCNCRNVLGFSHTVKNIITTNNKHPNLNACSILSAILCKANWFTYSLSSEDNVYQSCGRCGTKCTLSGMTWSLPLSKSVNHPYVRKRRNYRNVRNDSISVSLKVSKSFVCQEGQEL